MASAGEAVSRYARELVDVLRASDGALLDQPNGVLEPVAVAWRIADRTGAPLADVLGREGLGTSPGMEDLLLAAQEDPASRESIRIADVLEVYRMLGRSQREDRWRARLANGARE